MASKGTDLPGTILHKSGWLSKEGKRLKGRSRRYLMLEGTTLSHRIKENAVATWEVDINEVRLSLGERPLQFLISAGGRSVAFFADSHQDLVSWVSALKSASSVLEDFYIIGRQLGKGSYGEVFLSTDKLTGDVFAVKIIQKNPNNRKQKKFIERERTIMTTVNHPNIVRTVDVFEGPAKLAIVSEFMEGGELFDLIIASQYFTEAVSLLLCHNRNTNRFSNIPVFMLCFQMTDPFFVCILLYFNRISFHLEESTTYYASNSRGSLLPTQS